MFRRKGAWLLALTLVTGIIQAQIQAEAPGFRIQPKNVSACLGERAEFLVLFNSQTHSSRWEINDELSTVKFPLNFSFSTRRAKGCIANVYYILIISPVTEADFGTKIRVQALSYYQNKVYTYSDSVYLNNCEESSELSPEPEPCDDHQSAFMNYIRGGVLQNMATLVWNDFSACSGDTLSNILYTVFIEDISQGEDSPEVVECFDCKELTDNSYTYEVPAELQHHILRFSVKVQFCVKTGEQPDMVREAMNFLTPDKYSVIGWMPVPGNSKVCPSENAEFVAQPISDPDQAVVGWLVNEKTQSALNNQALHSRSKVCRAGLLTIEPSFANRTAATIKALFLRDNEFAADSSIARVIHKPIESTQVTNVFVNRQENSFYLIWLSPVTSNSEFRLYDISYNIVVADATTGETLDSIRLTGRERNGYAYSLNAPANQEAGSASFWIKPADLFLQPDMFEGLNQLNFSVTMSFCQSEKNMSAVRNINNYCHRSNENLLEQPLSEDPQSLVTTEEMTKSENSELTPASIHNHAMTSNLNLLLIPVFLLPDVIWVH